MRVAFLVVTNGAEKGKHYELAKGISTLGRDQTNSIQIPDPEISRRHVELHVRNDDFYIVDLDSSNGIFVNGSKIESHKLQLGDQIRIGKTSLIFADSVDSFYENPHATVPGTDDATSGVIKTEPESVSPETADWIFRAKSNLEVMYQTAIATSYHTEIDTLLDRLLDLVFTWISADRACVLLRDPNTNKIDLKCLRYKTGKSESNDGFVVSQAIVNFVLENNEGILSSDVSTDERLCSSPSLLEMESTEVICVPIRGRSGIRGFIYVDSVLDFDDSSMDSSVVQFDEAQLKMMIAIGHQAAVAIENAKYYSTLLDSERATAVGQVMESLSHHIKNILQSINGGTHLIEDGLKNPNHDLIDKGWHIVQRNQESLSNLVMDMLAYSKPRSPNIEPGNLNRTLAKAIKSLSRRAEYFRVEIDWQECLDLPTTEFDPAILERVFYSLISTAINSCRDNSGGIVKIEMGSSDTSVEIEITDNGTQLSDDELSSIFDPLVINEHSNRTGIGMAVSQKSILEHNGTLHVARDPQSGGTKFLIRLPHSDHGETIGAPIAEPIDECT